MKMLFLVLLIPFQLISNNGIQNTLSNLIVAEKCIHFGLDECSSNKTTTGNIRNLKSNCNAITYGYPFPSMTPEWQEIKSFSIELSTPTSKGAKLYNVTGGYLPKEVKSILENSTTGPITIVFKKVVVLNAAGKPKTLEGKFTFIYK